MKNHLLARLPHSERDQVTSNFEEFALVYGDRLCEHDRPCRHVYFPLSGFVSLVAHAGERQTLGTELIGNEGMLGAILTLGTLSLPEQGTVQGAGMALRMPTERFVRKLQNWPTLHGAVNRYISVSMAQLSLTAACARFHETEARLARWLLMSHDRARGAPLRLTHELLSELLGVRRSSITIAACDLQQRNLISYTRGEIRIMDRPGLEAASCCCYKTARADYRHLLG